MSPNAPVIGAQIGESIRGTRGLGEWAMLGKIYTYKNLWFFPLVLHPLDFQQKAADVSNLIFIPNLDRMFQGSLIKFLRHVYVTLDLSGQ